MEADGDVGRERWQPDQRGKPPRQAMPAHCSHGLAFTGAICHNCLERLCSRTRLPASETRCACGMVLTRGRAAKPRNHPRLSAAEVVDDLQRSDAHLAGRESRIRKCRLAARCFAHPGSAGPTRRRRRGSKAIARHRRILARATHQREHAQRQAFWTGGRYSWIGELAQCLDREPLRTISTRL